MPSNPQRYDDRDLPSGKRPPDATDLSDPSRSGRPNSPDHHKLHSGEGTVRRDDQRNHG